MPHGEGLPRRFSRKRKYRRFDLQFPVSLSVLSNGAGYELDGVSKNVSLGGVLVQTCDQLPLHTQVSMTMTVVGLSTRRPVRLMGSGEIVRVDPLGPGAGFSIAVECIQPITEMEDCRAAVVS